MMSPLRLSQACPLSPARAMHDRPPRGSPPTMIMRDHPPRGSPPSTDGQTSRHEGVIPLHGRPRTIVRGG